MKRAIVMWSGPSGSFPLIAVKSQPCYIFPSCMVNLNFALSMLCSCRNVNKAHRDCKPKPGFRSETRNPGLFLNLKMGFKIRKNGHFEPTNNAAKLNLTFQLNTHFLFLGIHMSTKSEIVTNSIIENWGEQKLLGMFRDKFTSFCKPKPETRVWPWNQTRNPGL